MYPNCTGGGYMLVARGVDRDQQLYWQTSMDGTTWTYRELLNGSGSTGPALYCWGQYMNMVYRGFSLPPPWHGPSYLLYGQQWQSDQKTWTDPQEFATGGQVSSESPGIASDPQGNRLVVLKGAGNDTTLQYEVENLVAGPTTPLTVVPGETSGQPAVVAIGYRRFLVAIKGTNDTDNIYWTEFNLNNTPPYGLWYRISEVGTTHGPALARDQDGTVYMAWKGAGNDYGLYFSKFTGQGWQAPRSGGVAVQDTIDCVCGTSSGPALAGVSPFAELRVLKKPQN
jgi:hypothetical protein